MHEHELHRVLIKNSDRIKGGLTFVGRKISVCPRTRLRCECKMERGQVFFYTMKAVDTWHCEVTYAGAYESSISSPAVLIR